MKKLTASIISILLCFTVYAQNGISSKSIQALRKAYAAFEGKEYGKALNYAEEAILYRKEQVQKDYETIQKSLASRDFKKAGDSISSIIPILEERDEYDCINIINFYNSKGNFDNSIKKVLAYIQSQEQYPEAQKLIGDIYKLEGEYSFAEKYYLMALENASVLDVPDERYEIIYLLADLSRLQNDYDTMEIRLLNVIGKEQNERNMLLSKSMKNTVSRNNKAAIEKFFTMYRTEGYFTLKACSQLSEYYLSINQYDKAFNYSAIAVITGFTKVYDIISKRDISFEYTDIASFLDIIPYHSDIVKWGNENDVWKSFNTFCEICGKCGYDVFASELLKILAFHQPQKFWQQDAVLKLDIADGISKPEKKKD